LRDQSSARRVTGSQRFIGARGGALRGEGSGRKWPASVSDIRLRRPNAAQAEPEGVSVRRGLSCTARNAARWRDGIQATPSEARTAETMARPTTLVAMHGPLSLRCVSRSRLRRPSDKSRLLTGQQAAQRFVGTEGCGSVGRDGGSRGDGAFPSWMLEGFNHRGYRGDRKCVPRGRSHPCGKQRASRRSAGPWLRGYRQPPPWLGPLP
jgi:hypothetical protein